MLATVVYAGCMETAVPTPGAPSSVIRARVEAARAVQQARAIADLAGAEAIAMSHLAEALQYWPKVVRGTAAESARTSCSSRGL